MKTSCCLSRLLVNESLIEAKHTNVAFRGQTPYSTLPFEAEVRVMNACGLAVVREVAASISLSECGNVRYLPHDSDVCMEGFGPSMFRVDVET